MPLDTLLDFNGNSYEIVVAAARRAQQLTDIRVAYDPTTLEAKSSNSVLTNPNPHAIPHDEKAVSIAFSEIFNKTVVYKLKND